MKKMLLLATMFLLFGAFAHGQDVGFNPVTSTVLPGDLFSVRIVGTGFASVLDGGGVELSFDQSVLNVTSVSIAPIWDPAFSVPAFSIRNDLGRVLSINFGSFANISGNFDIATIGFQAMNLGTSPLHLTEFSANPFASGGNPLTVLFHDGSVLVVPEVSTAWIVVVGLVMCLLERRMSRRFSSGTE